MFWPGYFYFSQSIFCAKELDFGIGRKFALPAAIHRRIVWWIILAPNYLVIMVFWWPVVPIIRY